MKDKKIRILVVTGPFKDKTGGGHIALERIFSRLNGEIFDVAVCGAFGPSEEMGRKRYERLAIKTHVMPEANKFKAIAKLRAFIRAGGYDIVHTSQYYANIYGRMAVILAGHPLIMTYDHGGEARELWRHRFLWRLMSPWTRRNVVVSNAIRDHRVERCGIKPDKVLTIWNGIDLNRFRPPNPDAWAKARAALGLASGEKLVGGVGLFHEWKRFDLMVEAAAKVISLRDDVRFILVGDGEQKPAIEELVRAHGLEGRVLLPGWLGDVLPVYQALDLFLMTSDQRVGFELVSVEAMACGVPVLAVDRKVHREVIGEGCGVFVKPEAEAIAQGIMSLLDDHELVERLKSAGWERAQRHFSIDRAARELSELYLAAVQEGRARKRSREPLEEVKQT